jgi:hypothetical protein
MTPEMKGFIGGFLTATLLWGAAAAAFALGLLDGLIGEPAPEAPPDAGVVAAAEPDAGPATTAKRRRRGRRPRNQVLADGPRGSGPVIESGDDLGVEGPRELDLGGAGGEARLSPAQIESAFDRAMPGIRRCLLMLEPDQEGTGRVTFGLRVTGAGRVSAAQLVGPQALTSGDVGSCLRRVSRAMVFPAFDGPEMVLRYPVTFE